MTGLLGLVVLIIGAAIALLTIIGLALGAPRQARHTDIDIHEDNDGAA